MMTVEQATKLTNGVSVVCIVTGVGYLVKDVVTCNPLGAVLDVCTIAFGATTIKTNKKYEGAVAFSERK